MHVLSSPMPPVALVPFQALKKGTAMLAEEPVLMGFKGLLVLM